MYYAEQVSNTLTIKLAASRNDATTRNQIENPLPKQMPPLSPVTGDRMASGLPV